MAEVGREPRRDELACALLEDSRDALLAVGLDGRILFWSRGATELLGFSEEEALGFPHEALLVPSEGRSAARRALETTVASGSLKLQSSRRRKDGSLVELE